MKNRKRHLKLFSSNFCQPDQKQNQPIVFFTKQQHKSKYLSQTCNIINSNHVQKSKKPLQAIKIQQSKSNLSRTSFLQHRNSKQQHQQTQISRDIYSQNIKLKAQNCRLKAQIRKYEIQQQSNRTMRQELEFRRQQEFQIFQHLRNLEKFNQNLCNQVQCMELVIQNYEQIVTKKQYQKIFGSYNYEKIKAIDYCPISQDLTIGNHKEPAYFSGKFEGKHIKNCLSITVIQDDYGNNETQKYKEEENSTGRHRNSARENHPITPKSQINTMMFDKQIPKSSRRHSFDHHQLSFH